MLGYGDHPAGTAAYSLSVFVAVAIVLEFARGTSARKALAGGSWPGAFVSLVNRNRRRYGGYIAHLAVVIFVIGATGATAYATVHEAVLQPGQTMQVRNYTLAFDGVTRRTGANFEERSAVVQRLEGRQVRWARSSPASAPTRPRARPRTRSRSAPTGATARTCS